MREYILKIIIASIVAGILCSLFDPKSSHGKIVKILTGILLTVTVLSPLKNISFRGLSDYIDEISSDAKVYVEEGLRDTETETAAIIKQQTETYILDKAKTMGLVVAVEVVLDENNSVPCGVVISGEAAPYEKSVLSDHIEDTLGISREYQQWK